MGVFKYKSRLGHIRLYIPKDTNLWEDFSSRAVKELLLLNLPVFMVKENESLVTYSAKSLDYRYVYKCPLLYLFYNYKVKRLIRKWNKQGVKAVLMWEV